MKYPNNSFNYWFTETEYSTILDNLVIVCVDTLVADSRGNILLGNREKYPLKDWWIFGGRMEAKENFVEASSRGIFRELGIKTITPPRFINYYDLVWNKREEPPINNGCHVVLAAMFYEIDDSQKGILDKEIRDHHEIRWFSPKELENEDLDFNLKNIIADFNVIYHPALI